MVETLFRQVQMAAIPYPNNLKTALVKTSRFPIYHCIGNHDDNDTEAFGDHFMDVLGPTYYSFDYGPAHFVAYDGVRNSWPRPNHQDEWLRADLDLHREQPVVFLVHFPWGISFYMLLMQKRVSRFGNTILRRQHFLHLLSQERVSGLEHAMDTCTLFQDLKFSRQQNTNSTHSCISRFSHCRHGLSLRLSNGFS